MCHFLLISTVADFSAWGLFEIVIKLSVWIDPTAHSKVCSIWVMTLTRGPTFGRGAWQSLRPQTGSHSKPAYHQKTDPTWLCNAHADCRLSLSVSVSTSDPLITCSHQVGILARVSSVVVERPSQLLWACCLSLNASSLAGDFCVEKFYLTEVDVVGQQVWETQKRYWYGDMEQIASDCSFRVVADRNSLSTYILFDLVAKSN